MKNVDIKKSVVKLLSEIGFFIVADVFLFFSIDALVLWFGCLAIKVVQVFICFKVVESGEEMSFSAALGSDLISTTSCPRDLLLGCFLEFNRAIFAISLLRMCLL